MSVVKLVTRQQRLSRNAAEVAFRVVGELSDSELPAFAREAVRNQLFRSVEPDDERKWSRNFVMLTCEQTAAVWSAIIGLPARDRPVQVRDVLMFMMLNVRSEDCRVMLTREEIAERVGCSVCHVSSVIGVLTRLNVIRHHRERIPGLRGQGPSVYYLNPYVGHKGSKESALRRQEEAEPPLLTLMQGGQV